MSWRARRCRRIPPTEWIARYFWVAASSRRLARCNSSSTTGRDTVRFIFQVDFGRQRVKCHYDIPSAENLRAMENAAPAASTSALEHTKRRKNSGTALSRFGPAARRFSGRCRGAVPRRRSAREGRDRRAAEISGAEARRRERLSRFSRTAMEEHWRGGIPGHQVALREPGVFELPHVSEAARIFDVHHGWTA